LQKKYKKNQKAYCSDRIIQYSKNGLIYFRDSWWCIQSEHRWFRTATSRTV